MATTDNADFYRKPYLTTATLALALLLFLLPFFDIKCNNLSMAKISGIDMAVGGKPTMSRDLENMQRGFSDRAGSENKISRTSSAGGEARLFITTLAALVLGVIGLVLSLINKGRNQRPTMIVGALGAVALIGSWIEISSYVNNNIKSQGGDGADSQFSAMLNVSASPTFWFILCLLCYLAAAFFSYKKSQLALGSVDEQPPGAAPQVKIANPGDQSEFPSAPESERDLG